MSNQNATAEKFRIIHDTTGDAFAYIAPVMAPALSAMAVYQGLHSEFGMAGALVGAFVVEGLGFATARLLMRSLDANVRSRAVVIATSLMSALYLIGVYGILTNTHVFGYVYAFPMFTVIGAGSVAVLSQLDRADTAERDAQRAAVDADAYAKRTAIELAAYKKQLAATVHAPVHAVHGAQQNGSAPERNTVHTAATVDDLRVYDAQHPGASTRQAAAALGMSASWVAKWRSKGLK